MFIFGTRPEAIKMAPVVLRFAAEQRLRTRVCVTAQHRRMLDEVLDIFGLKPNHDLDIMVHNQTLHHVTTACLTRMREVFAADRPGLVMVHGDTTTSFACALAAYYDRIPIAHVEAGLRSGRKYSPFPEEMNRVFVDSMADLLFAPTREAKRNLLREYGDRSHVYVTGNTGIDAVRTVAARCDHRASPGVKRLYRAIAGASRRLVVMTAHRRENFGRPFDEICRAVRELVRDHPDVELVYPAHPNPNVRASVGRFLRGVPRVHILEPLNYVDFAYLMKRAYLILTDSGGIQEEAAALRVPSLVLREVTERPEGLVTGILKLVGSDRAHIVREASRLLDDPAAHRAMRRARNPYGDGRASDRILAATLRWMGISRSRPAEFR